jgi:competence ComEA-like helix-hairpin-helix protein
MWTEKSAMAVDNFIQSSQIGQDRIQSFAFVIAALMSFLLAGYFVVSGGPASENICQVQLDEQINPNDASAASLSRLPGIGPARGKAIVAYRESFAQEEDSPAFQDADDLRNVKGIGPKTIKNTRQLLKFK